MTTTNKTAIDALPITGWLRDNGKECTTDTDKRKMANAGFGVWHEVAASYTTPLVKLSDVLAVLAPTVQEAEQGMPELPAPVCTKPASGPLFSAEQMQAYASAALAQRAAVAEVASGYVAVMPKGEVAYGTRVPTASTPPAPAEKGEPYATENVREAYRLGKLNASAAPVPPAVAPEQGVPMRDDKFTVIPPNMREYQMSVREPDAENDLFRVAFEDACKEDKPDDTEQELFAWDFFKYGWSAAIRCLAPQSLPAASDASVRNLALEEAAVLCEASRPASREDLPEHWKYYEKSWSLRELVANECASAIRALISKEAM